MANAVSVKVEGLAEIREILQRMGRNTFTDKEVAAALRAGGTVVQKEAIAKAPQAAAPHKLGRRDKMVEPGNLKRNIRVARRKDPSHFVSVGVGVRSKAFYWRFLEFGTVKMRARPFLRAAFEQTKQPALDAIIARLKKRVEAAARKAGV